jgi:biotin carboxyl carrier protein
MCAAAAKSAAIKLSAMKPSTRNFEVAVDSQGASLALGEGVFQYRRKGPGSERGENLERSFSVAPAGPRSYSVLIDGRSYAVALSGSGTVRVNGRALPVEIFDPRSMRTPGNAGRSNGPQKITAPMPGKVVRVLVEVGATVESGQGLIVVEAMKMQNEVKSPKAGRVAALSAAAGATVAAGDVLLVVD